MSFVPVSTIPLYILAGGQSSRFGSDKALAEIGGRTLIAQVAAQWTAWTSRTVVVAEHQGKYDAIGLITIADRQPGLGPVGGLLTALEDCEKGWLLLAACDAIFVDPEFPRHLFAAASDVVQAVAYKTKHWEPMPALYHCSTLPMVRARLTQGPCALWQIIESVPHRALDYPMDRTAIAQINTRNDLENYRLAHLE